MVSQELNERLTRTGRGRPAGEVLRRYWQPAALLFLAFARGIPR